MKTYHISFPFVTPPENGGQIVTRSYSYDAEAGVLLRCTHDASIPETIYEAFESPGEDVPFEPWNGAPKLGRSLGECHVA